VRPLEGRQRAVEDHVVERDRQRVLLLVGFVAQERHRALDGLGAAQVMEVLDDDVGEVRIQRALRAAVERVEHQRLLDVAHADAVVDDVGDLAAARGIGLDAQAVAGRAVVAVHRQVGHQHVAHAGIGFAADRQAVPIVEMVVREEQVARRAAAGLDRDVVVPRADVGIGQHHVGRLARIEAVRVLDRFGREAGRGRDLVGRGAGRALVARHGVGQTRRHDLDAPCRHARRAGGDDVEVGRVLHRHAVQRERAAVIRLDQARVLLVQPLGLVQVSDVPPGEPVRIRAAGDQAAAPAIDGAGADDAAARRIARHDQRVARLVIAGGGGAAGAQAIVVVGRVARGEQGHAAVDPQRHARLELQRAAQEAGFACAALHELDGLAGRAVVDGGLDAARVQLGVGGVAVHRIDGAFDRRDRGRQRLADRRIRRQAGLGHLAPRGRDGRTGCVRSGRQGCGGECEECVAVIQGQFSETRGLV